jgi:hypothetical protein
MRTRRGIAVSWPRYPCRHRRARSAARDHFGVDVPACSRTGKIGQRILIPPCGGPNPPAPASESGLRGGTIWGKEASGVFELAPLRRQDVASLVSGGLFSRLGRTAAIPAFRKVR